MADVKIVNVSKSFDGKDYVIKDMSFEVHDKEFVVLVGPSGCGKSTMLRMIAGLETITGGDIFIGGTRVNNLLPKDRDIAMVFQNYALYPHMTVYQNMAFGLKIQKVNKKEIDNRVREAAEILEISHLLERKPAAMSGGQRQRVAIGRAIVRKPKVFLFDEPLSNLDAKLRVQMRIELQNLHQKIKSTMIYVTHDQTEAMTLGDRIVVLKDGDIMQMGTPMELYQQPQNLFVAGFIGSPPINILRGKISSDNIFNDVNGNPIIYFDDKDADNYEVFKGREVYLGIRPENITEETGGTPDGNCRIPIKVTAFEHMGNEVFVYGNAGDSRVISRLPADTSIEVGNEVNFWFDAKKALFFDANTDKRLK
jgi:multiple sugar transport system ATP-binding protein